MPKFITCVLYVLLLSPNIHAVEDSNSDWPGWGGPNHDFSVAPGVIKAGQPFELKVVWKKELGSGYSAVSVRGERVVTMFSDSTFDYVIALNANDGSEFWRFKIDTTFRGRFGSANGPLSTPLLTGDKVLALSAAGKLFALDLESGAKAWDTDLVDEHHAMPPFYGFTTSPLVYNNILLVETGGSTNNALAAFDVNSGEVLWTAGSDTIEYQSPFLLETDDGTQFVAITNRALYGLQPATGKVLWRFAHGGSPHPMGAPSGNLMPVGGNRFFLKNSERGGMLMKIEYSSEMYRTEEVWSTKDLKASYVVPVHHGGYLFGYNSRIFTAVNVETGERAWRSRQPGDGFPIVVDGHLVVATKNGKLSVAPATGEGFKEIAGLDLFDDLVWAPASFANGKLFLRSLTEIASVDIVPAASMTVAARKPEGKVPNSAFARFVEKVEQAQNKMALIDDFMNEQKEFPVIEGDNLVHFIYRGEANDMALVGDLVGWRYDWPMHRIEGTDMFYYSSYLEPDARLTYKFTKDMQASLVDSLNTRSMRTMFFGSASWFSMPKWSQPDHLEPLAAAQSGRIDSLDFTSAITDSARVIEVYLPAGYSASQADYPVAYVHGAGGAKALGQITVSLDNLIGKRIEPVIMVLLPAFYDGSYMEYIGDRRDIYVKMLVQEIVPLIDRTYRTRASADNRANIGHLINGYMAFYATFKHPDVFNKVSVQSIWWDGNVQQRQQDLLTSSKHENLKIYFEWGKYDLRSPLESVDMVEGGRSIARMLRAGGYTFSGGEINSGAGWSSWKNRTDKVLETFFPLADVPND